MFTTNNLTLLFLNEISLILIINLISFGIYKFYTLLMESSSAYEFFKIKSTEEKVFTYITFILISIFFISLIMYRRWLSYNLKFDLYEWYVNLKLFLIYKSFLTISFFIKIILILSILILFLMLITIIKKIIYIFGMTLHIYFLRKEKQSNFSIIWTYTPRSWGYYNITNIYAKIFESIGLIPYFLLKPILIILFGFKKKKIWEECKHIALECVFLRAIPNYHYYILLFSIYYDIIYGNMVLTYLFKLLPFAFIYYILLTFYIFFQTSPEYKLLISTCYYIPCKYDAEENEFYPYRFDNGIITNKDSIRSAFERFDLKVSIKF